MRATLKVTGHGTWAIDTLTGEFQTHLLRRSEVAGHLIEYLLTQLVE